MSVHISFNGLRDRRMVAATRSTTWGGTDIVVGRRRPADITAIVLHQTTGHTFLSGLPARRLREHKEAFHTVDQIRANFVILLDGTVFYTHDVEQRVDSVGGLAGPGIDVEFACDLPFDLEPPSDPARRLTPAAICAGRDLILALRSRLSSIHSIHPHGQVQMANMDGQRCGGTTGVTCGKFDSCPGPDIWVNVGRWAVRFGLLLSTPSGRLQNNGISHRMDNTRYDQHIIYPANWSHA